MLRSASVLMIVCTLVSSASAQGQKFPYQARVTADEVYARSGAGEAFYPTKSLVRDTTVTVRRHDPGGWYMIDPPEDSFSWIPAKYVQRTATGAGEVLESNVVVFVGSAFGDETHVWQRKLMAGEKIAIISEQEVETLSGPKRMYRIEPPAREYRWVPGSSVLPVGAAAQKRRDLNPYEVPSDIVKQRQQNRDRQPPQPAVADAGTAAPQPVASRYTPSDRLARITTIRAEQRQLKELDQKFRGMILSDPSQWKLEELEQAYLKLQNSAEHKPVAGQIDLRYPAIRRYRQRKAELDDLNRLTSETERRDAQLLSSQFGLGDSQSVAGSSFALQPGQSIPFGSEMSQPGFPVAANGSVLIPNIDSAFTTSGPATAVQPSSTIPPITAAAPTVASNQPTNVYPEGSGTRVYVGAGYVQRGTADEGAGYLLLSNEGKVLAHLQPSNNVNLEEHIGRAVGVKGNRYFDKSIKSDRIDVTSFEPVTIR